MQTGRGSLWRRAIAATTFSILFGVGAGLPAVAQDVASCPDGQARRAVLVVADGPVFLIRGATPERAIARGTGLCPGDRVRTGAGGRAELRFIGEDTTIGITAYTTIALPQAAQGRADTEARDGEDVTLIGGLLRFVSSVRGVFSIGTRFANAGIDGTEAIVAVGPAGDDTTLVLVREGTVRLASAAGAIALGAGDAGAVAPGAAPGPARADDLGPSLRRILVAGDGAADWAIHYPPLLLAAGVEDPRLARAAALLVADDPEAADDLLASVPVAGRTGAAALSLRALVAVLRGRAQAARSFADRAVALDPDLGAAEVARSYVLQAEGEIEAAFAAAGRATALSPEDAYALAREAELALTLGRARPARARAEAALAIADLALAHAVIGLAALAENDDRAALAAFDAAVSADDSAPLPRLGRGLALIRRGALAAGRREIELATSLDPRGGNLRTWLGRAYFEEGLAAKARSQFALAKDLDPESPTPWLFSAAERFTANSPLEALSEIDAARERTGSRAVLRGALGLGEDRAVTSSALGRAYDALGFTDQARSAGARAIEQDPTNAAAHRILADLYAGDPGLSFARSSAALRAKLLSPPTRAPVDSALSEPDLTLFEQSGPGRASFGEYTPFFEADGVSGRLSLFGGTQGTAAESLSLTARHGALSGGLGQSFYTTDGYRANNDLRHALLTLEGRAAIAPGLTVFGELGLRDSRAGDRALEADTAFADLTQELRERRGRARLGLRMEVAPGHDILAVMTGRTQDLDTDATDLGTGAPFRQRTDATGIDLQAQHIARFGPLTTIAGGSIGRLDRDLTNIVSVTLFPFGSVDFLSDTAREADTLSGYGYAMHRLSLPGAWGLLESTVGIGIDRVRARSSSDGVATRLETTVVSPKAGLRLVTELGLTLRAAYTETVTPDLLFDQRLEPVTVAGLAQFRPEAAGSEVRQAMVAADQALAPWLSVGGSGTWRRIDPLTLSSERESAEEIEGALYADFRLGRRLSARLSAAWLDIRSSISTDPDRYRRARLGGEVRYFDPGGLFATAGLDFMDFESVDSQPANRGDDVFLLGTVGLGYRLPDRRGVVSLELSNVFDRDVDVVDRPVRAFDAGIRDPDIARGFTALARVTLSF